MIGNSVKIILMLVLCLGLSTVAYAGDTPCPWRISSIKVGKWGNGNQKARIWVNGSFPIPPGVSERPIWYVNGTNVGHSEIYFNSRTLPNASQYLKEGYNVIKVQFTRPPYSGASNEKNITNFSWDEVRPGQYKTYN